MAALLKFLPGSIIRWRSRQYIIIDYAGLDAILGRQPGKRRLERIPINEENHRRETRQSHRWYGPSADNNESLCHNHLTNNIVRPEKLAHVEVFQVHAAPRHLQIALPRLHLFLPKQPLFANISAFDNTL